MDIIENESGLLKKDAMIANVGSRIIVGPLEMVVSHAPSAT